MAVCIVLTAVGVSADKEEQDMKIVNTYADIVCLLATVVSCVLFATHNVADAIWVGVMALLIGMRARTE